MTFLPLVVGLVSGALRDPLVRDLIQSRVAHWALRSDTPSSSSVDRSLRLIDLPYRTEERLPMALIGLHTIMENSQTSPELRDSKEVHAGMCKILLIIDKVFRLLDEATSAFSAGAFEQSKYLPLRARVVITTGIGNIHAYVQHMSHYGIPTRKEPPLRSIMTSLQNTASLMYVAKDLDFSKLGSRLGRAFKRLVAFVRTGERLRWLTLVPDSTETSTGFEWFLESEELTQIVSVMDGHPADKDSRKGKGLMVADSIDEAVIFTDICEFALTQVAGPNNLRMQISFLMSDISVLGNKNLDAIMQRVVLFRDALDIAQQLDDKALVRAVHVELFRNIVRAWAHMDERMKPFCPAAWVDATRIFFSQLIMKSHTFAPIHKGMFTGDKDLKRQWVTAVVELTAFVNDLKAEEDAAFILIAMKRLHSFFVSN